jgi:hypothetical protein
MSLKRKREEDDVQEAADFDDEALALDLDELDDEELNDETITKIRKFVDSAEVTVILFETVLNPRRKD